MCFNKKKKPLFFITYKLEYMFDEFFIKNIFLMIHFKNILFFRIILVVYGIFGRIKLFFIFDFLNNYSKDN